MYNNIYDLEKEKCTGCSACLSVCNFNAIKAGCSEEGFMIPVIDETKCTSCGACSAKCPVLNTSYDNNAEPKLYAARASDKIRSVSSSGGMFTVIAEEIIKRGGAVCSAAYDAEMNLSHVIVNYKEDLKYLRGSKYVQSNTDGIYKKIAGLIKEGKQVLFTGTPCQVAAVKSVAGNSENLFTADILCHGVPSHNFFRRYLDERFPDKKVTDVEFRNKKFGWSCEHIRVVFEDGTDYEADSKNDPYLKAFFRNLSLRVSCSDCPFASFPRQGDITLGDFWGITALDKTQSDKKGTSIVYVNSKKGEKLFADISKKLTVKEYNFKETAVNNRIKPEQKAHESRYRFFRFLSNSKYTIEQALSRTINGKYDIGIVSNYYAGNFGGSLTQYALYNVLENMGYSCLMIERPADSNGHADSETLKSIYLECPYKPKSMARQRETKYQMAELNNACDMFVVGSDQLFQYSLFNSMGRMATLDWVNNNKKKIAYAASYGHDFVWGDPDVLSEMSFFMRKFDAFSVREKSGVEISKEKFGVDAEWVLDPVFLCDVKHYYQLADKSERRLPEHYIASYILDPSEDKAVILKRAEKKLGIKAQIFSEFGDITRFTAPLTEAGLDVFQLKVEERLQLIRNCDFFISDSFHGTCFAIIMGKPFISIINKKRGGSRFESLLSMFGVPERLIYDSSDLDDNLVIFNPVDYSKVNVILNKERRRSLNWLKDALEEDKKLNTYCDYDVLIKLIREQHEEINELKKKINILSAQVGLSPENITDINEYLENLITKSDKYTIYMSVKDTPGLFLSKEVAELLLKLGVKNSLVGKHWNSFGCIIDGGKNIFEQLGPERVRKAISLNEKTGWLVSANFNLDNVSKIILDKKDYSVNRRGLNIVVWDKENDILVDSVCFDMHLKNYLCIRNK